MPFQKGHKFYGDLTKSNYFKKGESRYPQYQFQKGHMKYKNAYVFKKGHKHSQEVIEKIIKSNKGKVMPIKRRLKISQTLKGKPQYNRRGKKHWNWKGGISSIHNTIRGSLEYKLWQDSIFNRDGNKCQKCGCEFISKLVAHHILNFSNYIELRFAIDNGITLCRDCHKKFHRKYGKKNNTKEQLEKFLTINEV